MERENIPAALPRHSPLRRLLRPDAPVSLGAWYGEPLTEPTAHALLSAARAAQRQALTRGAPVFAGRILELVARFWLGRDIDADYRSLAATAGAGAQQALVELVMGQLLLSRKLSGADAHLQAGFAAAAGLLSARAYFRVLKRHELLGCLALSARPAPPQGLRELRIEAGVIRRLQGHRRPTGGDSRRDTLG